FPERPVTLRLSCRIRWEGGGTIKLQANRAAHSGGFPERPVTLRLSCRIRWEGGGTIKLQANRAAHSG
ncbi:hypothetical protein, partial [Salmonella enterica]|uniref:hypothetical protein n=1 Tax=Salmonella enterica TaxID=28901 RepID=UPI002FCDD29E